MLSSVRLGFEQGVLVLQGFTSSLFPVDSVQILRAIRGATVLSYLRAERRMVRRRVSLQIDRQDIKDRRVGSVVYVKI